MKTIRQELESLADERYREFSSKLIPGIDNMLGVRLPVLRKIAKRVAKEDPGTYLADTGPHCFEEIMMQGMVIGYLKDGWKEKERHVARFVPKIDNWSVCDSFCTGLKFTESEQGDVWDFLQPYLASDQAYEIRFAVVMLLCYFVEERYAEPAFSAFDRIRHDDYYVRMAVAWAVSIYYRDLSEITETYLINNRLDDWTHNKALQKITESLAVGGDAKAMIRSMKRMRSK